MISESPVASARSFHAQQREDTGEFRECVRLSSKAIEAVEDSVKLNRDEKEYLKIYAINLMGKAIS